MCQGQPVQRNNTMQSKGQKRKWESTIDHTPSDLRDMDMEQLEQRLPQRHDDRQQNWPIHPCHSGQMLVRARPNVRTPGAGKKIKKSKVPKRARDSARPMLANHLFPGPSVIARYSQLSGQLPLHFEIYEFAVQATATEQELDDIVTILNAVDQVWLAQWRNLCLALVYITLYHALQG